MSDIVQYANYLRFYHTSDDSLKDKDLLKNQVYNTYQTKVGALFLIPLGFQFWQLYLVNNFDKLALYKKVRIFKFLTFVGALGLGINEKWNLEKQWQYINRFYPEPTELQKSLYKDAMMFKEINYEPKSSKDKKLDQKTKQLYTSMYQLPPQSYPDPDDNPNPATIKTHY